MMKSHYNSNYLCLEATYVIKATQTTKKYERDTIIENQPKWLPAQFEFFRHVSFSPPSMDHQWPIDGPSLGKLFWIQTLPMDGPWVDHAWPCMGVHGISVREVYRAMCSIPPMYTSLRIPPNTKALFVLE